MEKNTRYLIVALLAVLIMLLGGLWALIWTCVGAVAAFLFLPETIKQLEFERKRIKI